MTNWAGWGGIEVVFVGEDSCCAKVFSCVVITRSLSLLADGCEDHKILAHGLGADFVKQ